MNPNVLFALVAVLHAQGAEDLGVLLGRARSARDAGRYPEALGAYQAMLAQVPTHETALLERAQTLSWSGDYPAAIRGYQAFRALYPQRALEADPRLAQVLAWSGRHREAQETLAPWVREGQRQAVLDSAVYLSWTGSLGAALERLEAWLKTHPEDLQARLHQARIRSWTGRLDRARMDYEAVLQREPRQAEAILGLARLQLWAGNPRAAREALGKLEDRTLPEARILEAQVLMAEGRPREARADLVPLSRGGAAQRDARELLTDLDNAEGRWVELSQTRTDTNEGLRTEDPMLRLRNPLFEGHWDLGLVRHSAVLGEARAYSTEVQVGASYPLGPDLRVSGGLQRLSDLAGSPATGQNAGLAWRIRPGLDLGLSYARTLAIYTPGAYRQRVALAGPEASLAWSFLNGRNLVSLGYGRAHVSAGSDRTSHLLAYEHRIPVSWGQLRAGLLTREFGYSRTLSLGFFNPERYRFHGASLGLGYHHGRVFEFSLDGRGGWQKVNQDSRQSTWSYTAYAAWNLPWLPASLFASLGEGKSGLPIQDPTDPKAYRERTVRFGLKFLGL
jgi:tetratricopeptide (TPR) repeat protein